MDRQDYFNNRKTQKEIVNSLIHKEASFIQTTDINRKQNTQYMNVWVMERLNFYFKSYNFFNRPYNIYRSLLNYKSFPIFSINFKERQNQKDWWRKEFYKDLKKDKRNYIEDIDFFIDIDCDENQKTTLADAWDTTNELKKLLDKFKVPYRLKFSGHAGFHIEISGHYYKCKGNLIQQNTREMYKLTPYLAKKLKKILKIPKSKSKLIDVNGVEGIKRIVKTPYNYDIITGWIALPLTDKQFKDFNLEMVKPENVISLKNFGNRGEIERFYELSKLEKINNTNKFIDYIIKNG